MNKMQPSFYVIAVSVILELSNSSPVYNLQPAYITANIGSTGRNIRNLPCISRRTNQSGVCMFAIDCLKSNGTHLGTCIDRFYFGSCCHVSPMVEITENSIDSSIIPNREPPNRISSTITPINKPGQEISSKKPSVPSSSSTTTKPTTNPSLTTLRQPISNASSNINNENNSSTSLTSIPNSSSNSSSDHISTSNSTVISSSSLKQTTPITTTMFAITTHIAETTVNDEDIKFSTFQSVESNDNATMLKPTNPTLGTTTERTVKPVATTINPSQTSKPKPAISNTLAPPFITNPIIFTSVIPHRTTVSPLLVPEKTHPTIYVQVTKPIKTTKVPIKITTKPYKINKTTLKPLTLQPNKEPTIFTKLPTPTTMPVRVTSSLATNFITSANKLTTINIGTVWPTRTPPSFTFKPTSTDPINSVSTSATSQLPNEIVINGHINGSFILETINGNPATNEIESSDTPTKLNTVAPPLAPLTSNATEATTTPGLVTWQSNNAEAGVTDNASADPSTWQPVTTPDSWVLLPSIATVTETSSSTFKPSSETMLVTEVNTSTTDVTTTQGPDDITDPSSTTAKDKLEIVVSTVQEVIENATKPNVGGIITTTEVNVNNTVGNTSLPAVNNGTEWPKPVNMSDFTDVCGRRMYPEARIVGGEKSSFGRWPWQISLRQWRTSTYLHKCGAALLNENWAITAAHCVDNVPPSDLLLRLGEHDLSTESEPYLHQERRVQIVASHPQFDPRTFEYDLALLRFYEPVTFQPNILPVCVPQTDETFVSRSAYVTGWGRLYEDGPLPSILQEVSVPVINNTVCESMYRAAGYIEHIPYIFICAGWRRGGFDSCEGDSGGPMVIQREDKRFLLAGVISWGIGCAEPNQPGVYTRISEFRDWINQILQF